MPSEGKTIKFYEENALELSDRFESISLDIFHEDMHQHFLEGAKILEIGCGSGRDAARALKNGFDITATDGSLALLKEVVRIHPELQEKTRHILLPCQLPFVDGCFDGFYSIACLMHLTREDFRKTLVELRRVVTSYGLVSLPSRRDDVDNKGFDDKGRLFNLMITEEWLYDFRLAGFEAVAGALQQDSLGREGINWINFFLSVRPR